MFTDYKVVSGSSPSYLTTAVTAAIADGFQPLGSPVLLKDGQNLGQALTKGTPDSGDVPAGSAVVADTDTVAVRNSAASDSHNGTAVVTAGAFTGVNLASTVGMVDNADTVAVVNSASGDSHNATATVTAGVLTNVKLAATVAMVDNADAITMQNSAGAAIAGTHPASVSAGVVANVKLAATVAPVVNGQALTGVAPTGVYTNTVTFTVANGVITAIVLS